MLKLIKPKTSSTETPGNTDANTAFLGGHPTSRMPWTLMTTADLSRHRLCSCPGIDKTMTNRAQPLTCPGALLPSFSIPSELPIQNLDSGPHPLEGVATHRPLLSTAGSLGLSKQLGMAPGSAFSAAPPSQQSALQVRDMLASVPLSDPPSEKRN